MGMATAEKIITKNREQRRSELFVGGFSYYTKKFNTPGAKQTAFERLPESRKKLIINAIRFKKSILRAIKEQKAKTADKSYKNNKKCLPK